MKGWRDGGTEGWRDGGMEGWRYGGVNAWRNGGLERGRGGGVEGWRGGRVEGRRVDPDPNPKRRVGGLEGGEDGRRGGKTSRKCWLNNALKVIIVTPSLIDQVPAVVTPFLLCFRCESFTWWPLITLHGTFLMAFAALKHLTMLVVSKLVDLALPYLRADGS